MPTYQETLEKRQNDGLLRQCRSLKPGLDNLTGIIDGKRVINFSGNNYLGLAQDERLIEASIDATRRYGTSSSASRLISGTQPLVVELEEAVAAWKGTEAALVFNSGFQANATIFQALTGKDDFIFYDKLCHASIIDGCKLSDATTKRYRHLDLNHLEKCLQSVSREATKWIVTESVFSMDGDVADLKSIVNLAKRYNALVYVDEAHGTGVYGNQKSSGVVEAQGVSEDITLQLGTFSKALGSQGAYVAGSKVIIDTLVNNARGFIYSTALPAGCLAASLKAIEIVQVELQRQEKLFYYVEMMDKALKDIMASVDSIYIPKLQSPIVPIILGDNERTLHVSKNLLEAGFFVQAIRPPTVPPNTARLRLSLSAAHNSEQIQGLIRALKSIL